MKKSPYKEHWVVEIYGVDSSKIDLKKNFLPLADLFTKSLKVNVVKQVVQEFEPYGVSLVNVLEESHLAFHTWPEFNYLHIDLFTCSKLFLEDVDMKGICFDVFKSEDISTLRIN